MIKHFRVVETFLHGAERFNKGRLETEYTGPCTEDEIALFHAKGWIHDLSPGAKNYPVKRGDVMIQPEDIVQEMEASQP